MIKYFLAFIMLIHGLIHFMGFAKAYNYGNLTQITKDISKPNGLLWLFAAILFVVATILFLLIKESWPYIAFVAVVISQILIIMFWKDARFGTIANVIIFLVAIVFYATHHFETVFNAGVKKHLVLNNIPKNDLLTEVDIILLPAPVQKYIRLSGAVNKPKVKNMKVVFEGEMRDKGKDYFKFTSLQYNFFNEPARLFFMKGKMFGIIVPGYHYYHDATATMQIKLFGLINVVNLKGAIMNKAETVTVFNDMCLLAPATLIDKRIEWTAIDSLTAKAIFTNGINKISATLYFNKLGQLVNFNSDDRSAIDMKQYRFSTPVKDYIQIDGRNIMKYGETIWHYPDGDFVYGKFRLKGIEYNVTEFKK